MRANASINYIITPWRGGGGGLKIYVRLLTNLCKTSGKKRKTRRSSKTAKKCVIIFEWPLKIQTIQQIVFRNDPKKALIKPNVNQNQ